MPNDVIAKDANDAIRDANNFLSAGRQDESGRGGGKSDKGEVRP